LSTKNTAEIVPETQIFPVYVLSLTFEMGLKLSQFPLLYLIFVGYSNPKMISEKA
jgi:hypothetical protein